MDLRGNINGPEMEPPPPRRKVTGLHRGGPVRFCSLRKDWLSPQLLIITPCFRKVSCFMTNLSFWLQLLPSGLCDSNNPCWFWLQFLWQTKLTAGAGPLGETLTDWPRTTIWTRTTLIRPDHRSKQVCRPWSRIYFNLRTYFCLAGSPVEDTCPCIHDHAPLTSDPWSAVSSSNMDV